MTMGELKAERKFVKKQVLWKKVRRVILNWLARNGESIANFGFFMALLLALGSMGSIELASDFPKTSLIIMIISVGYAGAFAVWRMGD